MTTVLLTYFILSVILTPLILACIGHRDEEVREPGSDEKTKTGESRPIHPLLGRTMGSKNTYLDSVPSLWMRAGTALTVLVALSTPAIADEPGTYQRATEAYLQGRPAEALRLYEQGYAETKQDEWLVAMGMMKIELGRNAEARRDCEEFLRKAPSALPMFQERAQKCVERASQPPQPKSAASPAKTTAAASTPLVDSSAASPALLPSSTAPGLPASAARVHIESSNPDVRLFQYGGSSHNPGLGFVPGAGFGLWSIGSVSESWTPVCTIPCDAVIDRTPRYRITGPNIVDSEAFYLPSRTAQLTLHVEAGTSSKRRGGLALISLGVISTVIGTICTAVGGLEARANQSDPKYHYDPSGPLVGGVFAMSAGIGMIIGGGYLVHRNHTHVSVNGEELF